MSLGARQRAQGSHGRRLFCDSFIEMEVTDSKIHPLKVRRAKALEESRSCASVTTISQKENFYLQQSLPTYPQPPALGNH